MSDITTSNHHSPGFRGFDGFQSPRTLPPGVHQRMDDVVIEGASAEQQNPYGNMVTRQSLVGQLTSLLGFPITLPMEQAFRKSNGTTAILIAGNNQLFLYSLGATSLTSVTITGSPSFNSTSVFAIQVGAFVYIVDGVGPLRRISVDGTTASPITALDPPATAPIATLTNISIQPWTTTSGWTGDALLNPSSGNPDRSDNLWTNNDFVTGLSLFPTQYGPGSGNLTGGGYTFYGGPNIDFNVSGGSGDSGAALPSGYTGRFIVLDDPSLGCYVTTGVANDYIIDHVTAAGTTNYRHTRQVYIRANYYTADTTGTAGITFIVNAYASSDGTGNVIGTKSITFQPSFAGQNPGQFVDAVLTFEDAGGDIGSWRYYIQGAAGNSNQTFIYAGLPEFRLLGSGFGVVVSSNPSGLTITHSELTAAYQGMVAASRLRYNFGSAKDLSSYNVLVIGLGSSSAVVTAVRAGLQARLIFRKDADSTEYPSNLVTFSADGTYLSVDVSTIPQSIRALTRYLYLEFASSFTATGPTTSLFIITGLTSAGNLSSAFAGNFVAPYTYVATLALAPNTGNEVDSAESPTSVSLSPDNLTATGQIDNPPIPGTDTGALYWQLWRAGGTFNDGIVQFYRLVATVAIGSDVTYGTDTTTYGTFGNPYFSFVHNTGTNGDGRFLDNTPDSFLVGVPILSLGKGVPPTAAETVSEFANRLLLTKGNKVYLSWLLTSSTAAGLYFTYSDLDASLDPNASIKGAFFDVGAPGDNDPVMRAWPQGTEIIVFKQNSNYILAGDNANNFTLRRYTGENQVGLLARRAVATFGNRIWFLALDGVYTWDGGRISPGPPAIQNNINPSINGATSLLPAAYGLSAFLVADQRLILLVPALASDTGPTVALVLDKRSDGWVRWTKGPFSGFTSGAVFGAAADTSDLVFAMTNGQVVRYTGYGGDKLTPAASAAPVNAVIVSKQYGQDPGGDALGFFSVDLPQRLYFDVRVNETATLNITITGDIPGAAFTTTFTLEVGAPFGNFMRLAKNARGRDLTVTLSCATNSKTSFIGFLLTSVQGKARN